LIQKEKSDINFRILTMTSSSNSSCSNNDKSPYFSAWNMARVHVGNDLCTKFSTFHSS